MFLMIVTGGCCLGFLNTALPGCCGAASPVSEAVSGGTVELLGYGLAGVMTQLSTGNGFSVVAGTCLGTAILMSIGLRLPDKIQQRQKKQLPA